MNGFLVVFCTLPMGVHTYTRNNRKAVCIFALKCDIRILSAIVKRKLLKKQEILTHEHLKRCISYYLFKAIFASTFYA